MQSLTRKCILYITLISIAGLFYFAFYQWQKIHYREPIAAFYALASAMEHENAAELARLAPKGVAEELYKLAKPYGGIRQMGKLLRESPEVRSFPHVPFTSIEVVAKIEDKQLLILFLRQPGYHTATMAFFVG